MNVIGKINHFIGEHAKIEIIGFKEQIHQDWSFEKKDIVEIFKPEGFVFEPSFKKNYSNYKEGDILILDTEFNKYVEDNENWDHYKVKQNGIKKELNYRVVKTNHLFINPFFIDLYYLSSIQNFDNSKFYYFQYEGSFYGTFKIDKNKVVPQSGRIIKSFNEIELFQNDKEIIVLNRPNNNLSSFAAETESQIQDWFKALIKESNHPVLKAIKENPNWKVKVNDLVSKDAEIDKHRLELAINELETIDLTLKELETLSSISYPVKEVIQKKYDVYKEEIKNDLYEEIKNIELAKNEHLIKLNLEIEALENNKKNVLESLETINTTQQKKIETNNQSLKNLQLEISVANENLKYIEENKTRILRDFNIYNSISNNIEPKAKPLKYHKYELSSKSRLQIEKKNILNKIGNVLKSLGYDADSNALKDLLFELNRNKCILSDSLELILSVIKSINNCTYYYTNVEINWLSFDKLIDAGLLKAFEDAYNNSDKLHFFIIRDINISSPECFARPLLDFHLNLIPSLGSIITEWPRNLKVIGIIQPFPEIGLPIIESTFKKWYGCKRNAIFKTSDSNYEILDNYLDINEFYSFESDIIENHLNEYL